MSIKLKKICLVLPSLTSGGMERVMSQLAWHFCSKPETEVILILLTKGEKFYELPKNLRVLEPNFYHKSLSRLFFTIKIFNYLRQTIKKFRPDSILSFGGKYNSFVLLSTVWLKTPVFISDRSRPSISYGRLLDFLNPIIYRRSKGIIAQTLRAKEVMYDKTKHNNIRVIGNPVRKIRNHSKSQENIVLNVGRFIESKQQSLLVDLFLKVAPADWKLIFIGDGKNLSKVRDKVRRLNVQEKIFLLGNKKEIDKYYKKSKIFAFTSISEGFPNALGEAMAAGQACISFDCEAGPNDLIDDGVNGFLVGELDHKEYCEKLKKLLISKEIRETFSKKAKQKMEMFDSKVVGEKYFNFIIGKG